MKKRILSIILVLALCLTLMPMAAFATGTTYDITNGTPESAKETNHGYITVDKTAAAEGETVTITVKPNEGYRLKSLTVTPAFTVTFDLNGITGTAPEAQTITSGEKATKPADPTDTVHTFAGWYKTKDAITGALSDPWNFDTDTVTENMTLYAKWTTQISKIVGTNTGIPTVANFDWSNPATASIPENAWVTDDGNKAFWVPGDNGGFAMLHTTVIQDQTEIQVFGPDDENTFIKNGDTYVSSDEYGTFTCTMTDGKFTSLTFAGNDLSAAEGPDLTIFNGTYVPAGTTFKAVYDTTNDANALTFYYDTADHSGEGITVYEGAGLFNTEETTAQKKWGYNGKRGEIKSVVIDASVAGYKGLTSTAYMFQGMTAASDISGAEYLDVSNVTDMSLMFMNFGGGSTNSHTTLNSVPDVSKWNTANVTNMTGMFWDYGNFSDNLTKVPDVSKWNTANVTNMAGMFQQYGYSSINFNDVPKVSGWSTVRVEDMSTMFRYYGKNSNALTAVPDVSQWDTGKVMNMSEMFRDYGYTSTKLNDVPDVAKWNTEKVTNMSGMFYGYGYTSTALNTVPDVSNWKTDSVEKISNLFNDYGHTSDNIDCTLNLSGWDLSKITGTSDADDVFKFTPKTFNVTIPAKTGEKSNEGGKWYYGDGAKHIAPPTDKTFTPTTGNTFTLTEPIKSPSPKLLKTSAPAAPATIPTAKQQDGTYQFTMPAANVTVTAEFEAAPAYTTYENWQIKHEGSEWQWTGNLTKVEEGLFKLEVNWTGSGFNVASDENPIKKDWYAPEDLTVGEEVIAPVKVDVYLRVIDDETLKIGVGVDPGTAPTPDSETAKILAALNGGEQDSIPGVMEVTDDESTGFRTVKLLKDVNLGNENVTVAEGVFLDLNHFNLSTTGTVTNNGTIILYQENAGVIDYLLYNAPGNYGTSEELKLPSDVSPDYVIPANTFMTAEVGTNPAYQELGFASDDDMLVWNKDVPAGMQLDVVYSLKLGGNILSAKTAGIKDTNVTAVNFALNDNISIGSNTETDGAAVLNVTSIYDELFGDTIATFAANGKKITLNKTGKLVISSDTKGFDENVLVSGVQGMSIVKTEDKAAKTVTYSIAVLPPALAGKTDTTITMTAVAGLEYSIDGGASWVSDGGQGDGDSTNGTITFRELNANTTYTIIARVKDTNEISTASVITTKSAEQSTAAAEPVDVSGGEIKSGDTVVEVKDENGETVASEDLAAVAAAINEVLNNETVKEFGKEEADDDTGIIAATKDNDSSIAAALKAKTEDETAKGNVSETDISKYLNVTLVSADVDVDTTDGTTVTVNKLVFDVTPMATITVKGEGDASVTLTTEIENDEIDGTVTFLLPVDKTIEAETAAVYHKNENGVIDFLGNKPIENYTIEVEAKSFSEFSYIVLNESTAGAKIGNTLYASLSDAVAEVKNNEIITLLKDASDTITVSRAVRFTVKVNGNTNNATITAGSGYTVSKSGNTYTVEEKQDDPYIPYVPVTPSYSITGTNTENGKLTVNPKNATVGSTVTITVTPDKGFKLDTLTVKDAKGNVLTLTKLSNTTYTFKMPNSKVTISATFKSASAADKCLRDAACPMAEFSDLDMKLWYHNGIHFCLEEELMNGVGGGKFDPNGTTTRAMIVTMLWRLEGKPVANYAMSFKDVPSEQWYTEAVRWAQANKIVEGYSADKFGPDDIITREQLATILYRYAKLKGEGFSGSWYFLLDFVDTAKISTWADEAIHWCSMKGIVNGKDGKVFDPQGKATRAEAAAMIQRFCER